MNDPLEETLSQLTPRGVAPESREAALAATRDTLAERPSHCWDAWFGMAAAASLLLGISLNFWVIRADEARFAELYGPRPLSRRLAEVADSIESVTDPDTGRWVREQWRIAQASRNLSSEAAIERVRHHYQTVLNEIAVARKGPFHVEEAHQLDRDPPGRLGGDAAHRFRHTHVRQQYTA